MRIVRASWDRDNTTLRHVRYLVFVEEQSVPLDLEIDGLDPACVHVLAYDTEGSAIGTGRITPEGKIGRLAVLADHRRVGVGAAVARELLAVAAERGHQEVEADAQETAIPFWEKMGFVAQGETFMDAGIPHRKMVRAFSELG